MERTGMKNKYVCQICGGEIVTVIVHPGTTPFALPCMATENCQGIMCSAFYQVSQDLPAQFEWFMPASTEGYSPEMQDHIERGGLELRKIQK
jgi:hypothetical protein